MDPRHELGKLAEDSAEQLYLREGYRLLARNYRTKRGELDLVVEKQALVVFVEVKGRSRDPFLYPCLPQRQRPRLERAARVFLLREEEWIGPWHELRFDVVIFAHGRVVRRIEGESLYGA